MYSTSSPWLCPASPAHVRARPYLTLPMHVRGRRSFSDANPIIVMPQLLKAPLFQCFARQSRAHALQICAYPARRGAWAGVAFPMQILAYLCLSRTGLCFSGALRVQALPQPCGLLHIPCLADPNFTSQQPCVALPFRCGTSRCYSSACHCFTLPRFALTKRTVPLPCTALPKRGVALPLRLEA